MERLMFRVSEEQVFSEEYVHVLNKLYADGFSNIELLINPYYSQRKLTVVGNCILRGWEYEHFFDEDMSDSCAVAIYKAACKGYDAMECRQRGFNYEQIQVIAEGLAAGVDVSSFADPSIPASQMRVMLEELLQQLQTRNMTALEAIDSWDDYEPGDGRR